MGKASFCNLNDVTGTLQFALDRIQYRKRSSQHFENYMSEI